MEEVQSGSYDEMLALGRSGGFVVTSPPALKGLYAAAAGESFVNVNGGSLTYLPPASGGDDTAVIQAVLDANVGSYIKGTPGQSYKISKNATISACLKMQSGTTLDMRGCTLVLQSGSNCPLIVNAAWVAGSGRDSNIEITGGVWNSDATTATIGQAQMPILIQACDGVYVHDLKVTRSTGADHGRCVYMTDVTDFEIARVGITTSGVAIGVTGPAACGSIHDIYGTCGDDFIAISCSDGATYVNNNTGDVSHVKVWDIFPTAGINGVKFITGTNGASTYTLRNCSAENVQATVTGAAVYLGGTNDTANNEGGFIRDVSVSHVRNLYTGGGYVVAVLMPTASGMISGLELSHIVFNDGGVNCRTIQLGANLIADDITIRNCNFVSSVNTAHSPIVVSASGGSCTINTLIVRDCVFNLNALYGISMDGTSGTIQALKLIGNRQANAAATGGMIDNHSATTPVVNNLFISNHEVSACNFIIGNLVSTTNIYADSIAVVPGGSGVNFLLTIAAGGVITLAKAVGLVGTHACRISNSGTLKGIIVSQGNGVPGIAGQVGDLYWRQDGGAGSTLYRCTVAGVDGSATWTANAL